MGFLKLNRSFRECCSSFPAVLLFLVVILTTNGETLHAKLLKIGEFVWQDYFLLRGDMIAPSCDADPDISAALAKLEQDAAKAPADELDLFEATPFDRESAKQSLEKQAALCQQQHNIYQANKERVTWGVKAYRAVETSIAALSIYTVEKQRFILSTLLFICAITATLSYHHIAFRPVLSVMDYRVSSGIQAIGNLILLLSVLAYRNGLYDSGVAIAHADVLFVLLLGSLLLYGVSVFQVVYVPRSATQNGNLKNALLTVPIYSYMAIASGLYFILTEGHMAGMAIYFSQLFEQAMMFLTIGLYIWLGILIKQTMLGERVFRLLTPWKLPPEALAIAAILIMALPTAYTGASGVIIIALGGVVYNELRRVNARRQLALATTAISASAAVVLRPCLLIVIIAALNKEIVTDQLFDWGSKVFWVSVLVFAVVAFLSKREPFSIASPKVALPGMAHAFKDLVPYIVIFSSIAFFYAFFFNAYLDEFSAPFILPIIILACILFEQWHKKRQKENILSVHEPVSAHDTRGNNFEQCIRFATTESTVHVGSLLILMGFSFTVAGMIERSDVFMHLPEQFGGIWISATVFLVMLAFIGMVMDPFGAVVLVSGSIAPLAYKNGLEPVHFWIMTLVAFEFGYLAPPIALNHLLTRQVVGEKEISLANAEIHQHWWYRYERYVLPLTVMGITLAIVTYAPLFFYR
jgi:TRAP-type C4-dicarboxylate transport system permease large subunit